MFSDTLDITDIIIFTALSKKIEIGTCGIAKRGKHTGRGKESEKDKIRQLISRFPRMESHYARKDSKREYLDSSLNVQKIYELYVDTFERKKDAQRQFPNPHTDRFSALHSIFHSREESKTDAIFVQGTRTFSGTDMAEYRDLLN